MESQTEGVCPVCRERATLKCGGCKQQFYCNKDHQREDWPRHRPACKVWEIHENPDLGRHLLASRDLSPGDLIVSESPLVWGPALHTDQRVCVGCGKQCLSTSTRCNICLWPACMPDCPGLTDKNRHGLECLLLVRGKVVPRFVLSHTYTGCKTNTLYFISRYHGCVFSQFRCITPHQWRI